MLTSTDSNAFLMWHGTRLGAINVYAHVALAGPSSFLLCRIPMEWLRHSGDHTWALVTEIVSACVLGTGVVHTRHPGHPQVDASTIPDAGDYDWVSPDGAVTLSPGPASFKLPGDSSSSEDFSSRTSTESELFRTALVGRDWECLMTGTHWQACDAAHIVPHARQDVYLDLLQSSRERYMVSSGFLLSKIEHASYDDYRCSIYPRQGGRGEFAVHIFDPLTAAGKANHGKRFDASRFRLVTDADKPNVKLARWHWVQCVLNNFRMISVPE